MDTAAYETFRRLLEKGIAYTIEDAQKNVSDPLPKQLHIELMNFGQKGKELSLDEVMSFIYQDGIFPRIVDIAVRGIKDDKTLIWLRASDHTYVSNLDETWNTPKGLGPFKSLGLMLPNAIWLRSRPLSSKDLEEAGRVS